MGRPRTLPQLSLPRCAGVRRPHGHTTGRTASTPAPGARGILAPPALTCHLVPATRSPTPGLSCAGERYRARLTTTNRAPRRRLQALVRPRCAPDSPPAWSPLAPGHYRLRDTSGHMHRPALCARGRRAWQGGAGWCGDPRPLGTWARRSRRRETVGTMPPTPAHAGGTPAARPGSTRRARCAPAARDRGPHLDGGWAVRRRAPHRRTPGDAHGTATTPGHDAPAVPGPLPRATPPADVVGEAVLRPHADRGRSCRAPRTSVGHGLRHRRHPHGTDAQRRARTQGSGAPHTRPLGPGSPWRQETPDTPLGAPGTGGGGTLAPPALACYPTPATRSRTPAVSRAQEPKRRRSVGCCASAPVPCSAPQGIACPP